MSIPNPGSVSFAKFPHFDPVTVVKKPGALVCKSSTSLTNQTYQAATQTNSRINFSINLPKGTFVDRKIIFEGDFYINLTCTIDLTTARSFPPNDGAVVPDIGTTYAPVAAFGKDIALRPWPFHKIVNTTSLRLGSETFTQDTQEFTDTYDLILEACSRLKPENNIGPTNVSKLAINVGTNSATSSKTALGNITSDAASGTMNNGNYFDMVWVDGVTNEPLDVLAQGNFNSTDAVPVQYRQENGIPVITGTDGNAAIGTYNLRLRVRIREYVRIPPLSFNPCSEQMTGLWNIDTFNLDYQLLTNQVERMFYTCRNGTPGFQIRTFSNFSFATVNPIQNSRLQIKMHQPPLSLEIPKEVIIPYFHELQQIYTQQANLGVQRGATYTFQSQPQQISQIPHMVWICVQPTNYEAEEAGVLAVNGDTNNFYLPIESIQVRFDSSPSLLTNLTKDQLYMITNRNGVKVSREVYEGSAYGTEYLGIKLQTLSTGVLLGFGTDICLPEDLAPGVNGSFTFSVSVTIRTPDVAWTPLTQQQQIGHSFLTEDINGADPADGRRVNGYAGESTAGYVVGNNQFAFDSLRLKLQYFTKQYLAIDGNGQTVKMNGQVTKEDALKASLGPRQLTNMVDTESVGGGFFDVIKKGYKGAKNVWGSIPKPIRDAGINMAKDFVGKKMAGKGMASRSGGAKGKAGTKRMLSEMY